MGWKNNFSLFPPVGKREKLWTSNIQKMGTFHVIFKQFNLDKEIYPKITIIYMTDLICYFFKSFSTY